MQGYRLHREWERLDRVQCTGERADLVVILTVDTSSTTTGNASPGGLSETTRISYDGELRA